MSSSLGGSRAPIGAFFGSKSIITLRLGRLFAEASADPIFSSPMLRGLLLRFGKCLASGRRSFLAKTGLALWTCAHFQRSLCFIISGSFYKKARRWDEEHICGPWACRLVAPGLLLGILFGQQSPLLRADLLQLGRLLAAGQRPADLDIANSQR